jgi:hypothetical protein
MMALVSGLTCGVGNFFLGYKLSHTGALGPGFTGPLGLVLLIVYRSFTFARCKHQNGSLINFRDSNFFHKEAPHRFNYQHLIPLACNFIPNLLALIFIAQSFKYAELAGIN